MESKEEIQDRLRRLHRQEISKEMGGQVPKAKAILLLKILGLADSYPDVTGQFEYKESDILSGTYRGVDVSDYVEVHE